MKIRLTIACSLLLVAGCAQRERRSAYSESDFADPVYVTTTTAIPETGVTSAPSESKVTSAIAAQRQADGAGDATLITRVQENISKNPALSSVAPSVQVMAQHGTVTLTGTVSNESEKQLVAALVQNTSGVTTVDNQLQVSLNPASRTGRESSRIYSNATDQVASPSPAHLADQASDIPPALSQPGSATNTTDATLAALAVAQAPLSTATQGGLPTNSQNLNPASAQAQNDQGRVYTTNKNESAVTATISSTNQLTPTSQRPNSENRIYSTAPTAPNSPGSPEGNGISAGVDVQGSTETDRMLANKVSEELRTDARLAAMVSSIKIQIDNGKATLRGKARSEPEKQQIAAAIQKMAGVTSVENQLQVGSSTSPRPKEN